MYILHEAGVSALLQRVTFSLNAQEWGKGLAEQGSPLPGPCPCLHLPRHALLSVVPALLPHRRHLVYHKEMYHSSKAP